MYVNNVVHTCPDALPHNLVIVIDWLYNILQLCLKTSLAWNDDQHWKLVQNTAGGASPLFLANCKWHVQIIAWHCMVAMQPHTSDSVRQKKKTALHNTVSLNIDPFTHSRKGLTSSETNTKWQ